MRLIRKTSVQILIIVAGCLGVTSVQMKSPDVPPACRVGEQAPPIGFWTWAASSRVKVYVRATDFKNDDISYIVKALDAWNKVLQQTGSGIQFDFQGNSGDELKCEGCLTIERGKVFDKTKRHVTALNVVSARRDQVITFATIVVDPILSNPKALVTAIMHEIGHNLGLLDCFTCRDKSTVMNQFKTTNVPNSLATPSDCDVAQVAQVYRELRVRVRPSPRDRDAVDEGEEPVDDDTPIVTPTPYK